MSKTLEREIEKIYDKVGYNPIEEIRGSMFHWLPVPFNGRPVWMKCRCLNSTQIKSCGDVSVLNIGNEKEKKELTLETMLNVLNMQEALCRETLMFPSFDEIYNLVLEEDFNISKKKNELEELKKLTEKIKPGREKRKLEEEINRLELYLGFILPDDTMAFICSWALGLDRTDIKKVTRDMLLEASLLAKNGNDNPSDHITGVYTDFQKEDINKCAWGIYNEYLKEKEKEKEINNSKYNWLGRKK